MSDKDLKKELLDFFDKYINAYFTERNPDKTFAMFDDKFTLFGTAPDDIALNIQDAKTLYSRDMAQIPHSVEITSRKIEATVISKETGLISAVISIKTEVENNNIEIEGLRLSLLLQRKGKTWLIIHKHISLPAIDLDPGESYPLKELEKQNLRLEALVAEKTIELESRNSELKIEIAERTKSEEEIKRQLAEKETILKETHHRIKNNIASIENLLFLQMESVTNKEALSALQDAAGRVNSMRILYDKLLFSENYTELSTKIYLESLLDTVISLFPEEKNVQLNKQIDDFNIVSKKLFPVGIIINELITNIMKYAFKDMRTCLIQISLKNIENHLTLTIQDNGIGLPAGFDIDKSKGFGLMLVKILAEQLGGSFTIEN